MEGSIIYGGDFLSEIFILHVDNADGDLYKKLLKVIKENGHNIQNVSLDGCLPLQFNNLRILPDRHQVFWGNREVILTVTPHAPLRAPP